jgi:uncharacterized protein
MSQKVLTFLAISMGWAALVGGGLSLTGTSLNTIQGVLVMAVLYMPSPFVAAVIVERGIRRDRFRLPVGGLRPVLRFLLTPIVAILAFVLLYLTVVFVAGELLRIPMFGGLATSQEELVSGAAALLGQAAVDAAGSPPPAIVLLLAGLWGAIVAGFTVNGLFAMGEEYGWRGLMWDELKGIGTVRANVLIGLAWGLWHAPVILQGYNYPGHALAGIAAMVAFCTGMSFVLTAIRERTGSLLPVAAAHGMFNALATILLLLAPDTVAVVTGPLGLVGALLFAAVGGVLWRTAGRARSTTSHARSHDKARTDAGAAWAFPRSHSR